MNTPAVEIRGLRRHFARFALGPVDMTVPTGQIYGLIGPNGAGKTTLLDLIFGMGQPNAGTIRVLGLDHERDAVAMKRRTAYASPDLSFAAWGRVGAALAFVRGFHAGWDAGYAARLLREFHLREEDKVISLSFGARMKLALLLALAWRPEVLVLDEPTTGLDAESRRLVFAELLRLVQDEGRTVLISSHQIADLGRLADHVGILHNGMMLHEGPLPELTDRWRLVDFSHALNGSLTSAPGFLIQKSSAGRARAVVDVAKHPLASLAARGLTDVSAVPLPLEDLFIELTREEQP